MDRLYLLQFTCFVVTSMFASMLALARIQMRWLNKRYETSRWLIFFAMLMLAAHYVLQMEMGFRARGDEVGAVINILFYTPIAFLISYATNNIVCNRAHRRRFFIISIVVYAVILACFFVGYVSAGSLRIGFMLYVMLALFTVCMVYFIGTNIREMLKTRKMLLDSTAADLLPYDRYTWSSYVLLGASVLMLVGAIVYRPMLFVIGPLMLVSLFVFTMSFIGFGFNIMPSDTLMDDMVEYAGEQENQGEESDAGKAEDGDLMTSIESKLTRWCSEGGFRDSTVNMNSLSGKIMVSRAELTAYFEVYLQSSFRVWLSDIRFAEAQRMLRENPLYSNDTISAECGFSSHAHLYKIFKAKTGMTPGQWKEKVFHS